MAKEMHPCAVVTCERRCSIDYLMCRPHWAGVPRDLQSRIYATWGDLRHLDAYTEAVDEALAVLTERIAGRA